MILARRVALRPSPEQARALGRAAGTARWAYNWAVRKQREALARGEKLPTAIDLHRELNRLKTVPAEEGGVPWMYEAASKAAPQEGLRDAERAWRNYFAGRARSPRFRCRRDGGHFRLTGTIRVERDGTRVRLPRIGSVRITPGDRGYVPDGSYAEVSLVEHAGRWFASVRIEAPEAPAREGTTVGLDVGVRDLAHLSDGLVYDNPKALAREQKRLHRSRLAIARKLRTADKERGPRKKGERREESKRLKRERRRAARFAARVAHIRRDALHKATTEIARTHAVVVVEDLRIKNMTRRRVGRGRAAKAGLNRAILDSGMGCIRRMLAYKMPLNGGRLIVVPAAYTSRRCSCCGSLNDPGSSKVYECETCGMVADRDRNASLNILAAASWSEAVNARGAPVRPRGLGSAAGRGEARTRMEV